MKGKGEHHLPIGHEGKEVTHGRKALKSGGKVAQEERADKREDKAELKHGGKVKGEHVGKRLDKRARGGRMTPASPLSGAGGGEEKEFVKGGAHTPKFRAKGDDPEDD